MKTFVKAKSDYKDMLREGEYYELVQIINTDIYSSGKAAVIVSRSELLCFDAETFFF